MCAVGPSPPFMLIQETWDITGPHCVNGRKFHLHLSIAFPYSEDVITWQNTREFKVSLRKDQVEMRRIKNRFVGGNPLNFQAKRTTFHIYTVKKVLLIFDMQGFIVWKGILFWNFPMFFRFFSDYYSQLGSFLG